MLRKNKKGEVTFYFNTAYLAGVRGEYYYFDNHLFAKYQFFKFHKSQITKQGDLIKVSVTSKLVTISDEQCSDVQIDLQTLINYNFQKDALEVQEVL